MPGEAVEDSRRHYDPFERGRFPVGVRTVHAEDPARNRRFPCEIWYPATERHAGADLAPETQDVFTVPPLDRRRTQSAVRDAEGAPGPWPLVAFSHSSGGGRRQSTFLCTHLASHGYVVAALDHSETVAQELATRAGETPEQKAARQEAWIANRVPDVRFLIDQVLQHGSAAADPTRIAVVGHSFGGWTALSTPDVDDRIRAVVALAPAGSSLPKPGMLKAPLDFGWDRDVPTLYLVAENDVSVSLEGMHELFARTPGTKRMVVLRRADHMHFMDDVERLHEAVRAMSFAGELAWIPKEMRAIAELCPGDEAQSFVRGLTLCHLDAVLRDRERAQRFLLSDVEAELARRGVDGFVHQP